MSETQHSPELHTFKDDLEEVLRQAERLGLELVATLTRMSILDVKAALKDSNSEGDARLDN